MTTGNVRVGLGCGGVVRIIGEGNFGMGIVGEDGGKGYGGYGILPRGAGGLEVLPQKFLKITCLKISIYYMSVPNKSLYLLGG